MGAVGRCRGTRSYRVQCVSTASIYVASLRRVYTSHLYCVGNPGINRFAGSGGRGLFWGLTSHSNILGTVSSLAAVDSVFRWSRSKSNRLRWTWLIVLIIEVTTSLRAASRAALFGFFFCSLIIAYISDARAKRQLALAILFFGCASMAYVMGRDGYQTSDLREASLVSDLREKGLVNTRERLWADRIREFQSNPIFGAGFCMGDLAECALGRTALCRNLDPLI